MKRFIKTKEDQTMNVLNSRDCIEIKGTISLFNGTISECEITTGVSTYEDHDQIGLHEAIFDAVYKAVNDFLKKETLK